MFCVKELFCKFSSCLTTLQGFDLCSFKDGQHKTSLSLLYKIILDSFSAPETVVLGNVVTEPGEAGAVEPLPPEAVHLCRRPEGAS